MKRFYDVSPAGSLVPLSKRAALAIDPTIVPRAHLSHEPIQRDRSRSKDHVSNVRRKQREAKRGLEAVFA
ncbi:hypothetical protein [Burkholderia ubonensis]|uniref:hypothetical protein n=1 Tax=Burkholderia ubonensis TaxID=101571 RepID=UPI000757820E|nr:hypothetical protein [Burkholderia ubonensis]KVD50579.1 hypothetical protein WI86_15780 [Burkholderia ubonensis]